MKDNPFNTFPAHVLSSFIEMMVSQCDGELKRRISDDLDTLKLTVAKIEQRVEALAKGEENSTPGEGGENKWGEGQDDGTCTVSAEAQVVERTGRIEKDMNIGSNIVTADVLRISEEQEINTENKGDEKRDDNLMKHNQDTKVDNRNSRQEESCSEEMVDDEEELSDSFPLNQQDSLGPLRFTNKLRRRGMNVNRKRQLRSFGRNKTSSVHPGGIRMSVHEAPVFSESFASDNVRMVATDAFNIIDKNGDGYLQKEEVIHAIKMMEDHGLSFIAGGKDTAEIAENMMKEVDTDGDGLIDIDEFVNMMKRNVSGDSPNSLASYNNRMSQLARNVLLAHQKKIENSVIGSDLWMIHPYSTFHVSWDIVMSLLIVLTVITMPLSIGWDEFNKDFFVMNLLVDIVFLFDVVKNFCTGIVDENDAIIMDKRIVWRKYLSGFFITDFCSSIPLDLFLRTAGAGEVVSSGTAVSGTKNSLRMLRLLRMAKLLRLFRVSRLANQVKNLFLWLEEKLSIHISDGFTKLVRLGVGALVLGHWIGCFNFMLVRLHDFPEDSWVVYAGLEDQSAYTQWTWSFFKALAQMIMIGFETPPFTNASCDTASHWCGIEHWITLCCLYIGAVFYSLLISSISSILQTANLASRQFEEKLTQIDDYMRSKRLPAAMREKVKECFHLQHSNGKLYDENQILNTLTPMLRREIKLFTGRELSVKVPLLSSVSNRNFAEEMATKLEPIIAFPDEIILRENTSGDEMFFINSGVVEIYLSGSKTSAYVAIGDGCYFGEVSLLLDVRRTASARTKTRCLLFKISKDDLMTVLSDFPDTYEIMVDVAKRRQRRLKHYVNPLKFALAKEDEIDSEDSKTELFGADAEQICSKKEEEVTRYRFNTRKHHRIAGIQRSNPNNFSQSYKSRGN